MYASNIIFFRDTQVGKIIVPSNRTPLCPREATIFV